MSSSVNYSNINSILTRLDHFDDDFMIVEEKNQNLSMHISSYMGSEIQEIHDGSNIKLNDINEQFNSLNMYCKKEQVLDKSLSFQNICVEDKFFNKEVMDSNLGKDNWIDPIAEDGDEDVNESFFHENNYFIDKFCQKPNCFDTNTINNNLNSNNNNMNNKSFGNITLNEGKMENYFDENDKLKIKKNLMFLKLSKSSSLSSTNSVTKETFYNSNNNKSVLNDNNNKKIFNVTKPSEDFLASNLKLNMSSCQFSYKSKRGRKKILLSGIKTEVMDKAFLREFKKYLKFNNKKFKNIYDEDSVFWKEFLSKATPPFCFRWGDKKLEFKSYNKNFMKFIFSRTGVNTLYMKFINENRDINFNKLFKKKKNNLDYYTLAFYKFYRENLNKLYSDDYSEHEINVDDFELTNNSMDLINNSFQ